jgi:hypothetical protein
LVLVILTASAFRLTVPDARANGEQQVHLADSPSWCNVVTTIFKEAGRDEENNGRAEKHED